MLHAHRKVRGALERIADLLGREHVTTVPEKYSMGDCHPWPSNLVRPADEGQIQKIIQIARDAAIRLHPISTGKNWGYGSAHPAEDDTIILDLSRLNAIESFNSSTGLLTLEPGVTQGDLYSYLEQKDAQFMVPTTGAGPECSIIGNALERGYGITPIANHFEAITRLRVVFGNGEIYNGPFLKDDSLVSKSHRNGIGAYVDGLFTQSSFGIVTKASLILRPRPQQTRMFAISADEESVEQLLVLIQTLRRELGGILSNASLIDYSRFLSTFSADFRSLRGAPVDHILKVGKDEARKIGAGLWTIVGGIYTNDSLAGPAYRTLRKLVRAHRYKLTSISTRYARFYRFLAQHGLLKPFGLDTKLRAAQDGLDIICGKPNIAPLNLVKMYSSSWPENESTSLEELDVGLRWFAPLVPSDAKIVDRFVKDLRTILSGYEIRPLITLTSIEQTHFDANIPLLFDKNDEKQQGEIDEAYDSLCNHFLEQGLEPYRLGIKDGDRYSGRDDHPHWKLIHDLKLYFDPDGVLTRGKYT